MVVSPETVTSKFGSKAGIDILHLAQLGESAFSCAGVRGGIVLERDTVEQKDDFFGKVGYIAAGLGRCKRTGVREE
jgi:hypothetical protein